MLGWGVFDLSCNKLEGVCGVKYNVLDVAKYIVTYFSKKNNPISHLKLQKLLYFVWIGYYRESSEYLFDDNVCAWRLGPVVPSVYSQFCVYGSMPISRQFDVNIAFEDQIIINKTLKKYGAYSARELVDKTHAEDTPWSQVYDEELETRPVIPFEFIIQEELK